MMTRVLSEPTDFRRLLLLRHPELATGQQDLAVGDGAAELSRRGRAQVLDWLRWFEGTPIDAVFTGPQPQCEQAARALAAARELEVRVDARLRDQHMGAWQGRTWDELVQQDGEAVRTFFREFGEARAPDGESLGQAVERVLQWWVEQAPAWLGRTVAVVLPGSVLSGAVAALLGLRLSRCVSMSLPHGGVGVVDAYDNGVRIQSWNPGAVVGADGAPPPG